MMDKSNKDVILKVIGTAVAVFLMVYIGIYLTGNGDKSGDQISKDDAIESLESIVKKIDVKTLSHPSRPIETLQPNLIDSLPDISKYPPQVNSSTSSYIEIFSSLEKAGSGTDGWLTEIARDFNKAKNNN